MVTQNPISPVDTITLTIFSPSARTPRDFTWPASTIVGEAAKEAAAGFGVEIENPTFQRDNDEVIDRSITLRAAALREGTRLELVGTGGGA